MTGRNNKPIRNTPRYCVYCGGTAYTIDHVIPYSRGGALLPHNKVHCCFRCNAQKANRTPSEWLALLPSTDRRRVNINLIVDRNERRARAHQAETTNPSPTTVGQAPGEKGD